VLDVVYVDVEQLANCLPLHLMACVELPIILHIVGTLVQNFIYISIQVQDLEFFFTLPIYNT
jgi:uncharacterized membrane protein YhdT